jgi:2-amino-4-hydroxy-6-hydroxymethyldihydropteridine diphosphokinase
LHRIDPSKVGTVIKVSKVYETPSWVLTVTPSMCIIVHTFSSAHKILTEALKIEKELGVRGEGKGYQSRIIDIDLIAFDEEIINSEKLQIPHPLMQDRKFVLLPIQDLNLIGNIPF